MPLVRIAGVKCFITIFLPNYGFCTVFIFQMKNQCIDKTEKKSSKQELLVQCLYSNLHNARLINFLFS